MKTLLLVEDDPLISKALKLGLSFRGYEVTVCGTAKEGRKRFGEQRFDIAILDVNLPDGTGYELCKSFREGESETPILMLTARADEDSAVKGIDSGADDYVRKPFGLEELTARLNRLVGRKSRADEVLAFRSLRLSLKRRLVWVEDKQVALGKREFDILALLVQRDGEVVTREEIIKTLDNDSEMYDRTIDSHLSHLRKKLKDADIKDVQIIPVYGVGYRLEGK